MWAGPLGWEMIWMGTVGGWSSLLGEAGREPLWRGPLDQAGCAELVLRGTLE